MSKFLPCKRVCPVVAELRHDVANRDTEIKRLERDREALSADLLQFAAEIDLLKSQVDHLRESNRDREKRLAKVRQAAFGIVDWGIED